MGLFGMPQNPLMQPQTQDVYGNASTGGAMPPMAGGMLGAQAKKPGYNDPGGWAEKLSALGDILGRAGGMGGTGAMQALMEARQQRRQAEAAQYAPQHVGNAIVRLNPQTGQYETVYAPPPDAPAPGSIERNYNFLNGLDPNLAKQYVQGQANPMIGVDVQNPDGSVSRNFYPRSGAPSAAPAGGPTPGMVEGGYRFKGGNPADQSNWEPVGGAGSQAPRTFR